MTPEDLIAWRQKLGWTQERAARELGLRSMRTYQYLESHHTSAGNRRDTVPRVVELAVAELTKRWSQK